MSSYRAIELNDDLIKGALKKARGKDKEEALTGALFLAIANSADNYRLEKVLEEIAKEEFAGDVNNGKIRVDVAEGKLKLSWRDYANALSKEFIPSTYSRRPSWWSH